MKAARLETGLVQINPLMTGQTGQFEANEMQKKKKKNSNPPQKINNEHAGGLTGLG